MLIFLYHQPGNFFGEVRKNIFQNQPKENHSLVLRNNLSINAGISEKFVGQVFQDYFKNKLIEKSVKQVKMQHFIMFPQSYPFMATSPAPENPSPVYQKMLQTINTQSSTIKKLTDELHDLRDQVSRLTDRLEAVESVHLNQSQNRDNDNEKIRRKYFDDKFCCPYPKCEKSYGSSLALNLHIKQKHNGGTKKEREAYAKIIFNCEEKGLAAPEIECDFPPGFLEEERKKYFKRS